MIKVNKNAKQNIFSFILGAIIFGGISAYAATIISSSSVSYSNTSSGITSTNVQGAIDELYNKAKNPVTTATATKEQILSGQTAWVNGVKLTGTMLNQGAKTATINPGGSYTIPAGYHNGSGKITANPNQNSGTYTYAANSTGGTVDLGINNTYRYVNATNVYNKGKADGIATPNANYMYHTWWGDNVIHTASLTIKETGTYYIYCMSLCQEAFTLKLGSTALTSKNSSAWFEVTKSVSANSVLTYTWEKQGCETGSYAYFGAFKIN